MNRNIFNVTYDIVTPESAEDGDTAESGFIAESVTLRDAIQDLHRTRTSRVDGVTGVECDSSHGGPRCVTITNGTEFETGAVESRAIHIPRTVTAASARRIARLLLPKQQYQRIFGA